jgi:serine/threonine-protein kinase RsbW
MVAKRPRMNDKLDLSVNCDVAALTEAQEAIEAFARAHDIPERIAFALDLVMDEVISNIINHGFAPEQSERWIQCRAAAGPTRIAIVFTDNGRPFDPLTEAPEANLTSAIEDRTIGGLGVHLVKTLADETQYSEQNGENTLELAWSCS